MLGNASVQVLHEDSVQSGMHSHSSLCSIITPPISEATFAHTSTARSSTGTMDATNQHMFQKPIIALGNKHAEGLLAICFFLVLTKFALDIAWVIWRAWHRSYSRPWSPVSSRRRKEAYMFLAMAVLSFVVVNWVRWNMKDNLLVLWKNGEPPTEWFEKMCVHLHIVVVTNADWRNRPRTMWDASISALSERTRKIIKLMHPSIDESSGSIPTYLVHQIEQFHEYDISASVWDCFKMEVSTYCRFWW